MIITTWLRRIPASLSMVAVLTAGVVSFTALPTAAASVGATPFGAQPASDCYHSVWTEPSGDVTQLDVGSYGAFFDCTTSRWSFGVDTYDAWPDSSLSEYDIWTGGSSGGCNGFQWVLQARYQSGALTSQLWRLSSCGQVPVPVASDVAVTRTAAGTLYLSIGNATIGSPTAMPWFGYLEGDAVPGGNGDDYPDGDIHLESGFTGTACTADPFGETQSAAIVESPAPAVNALRLASLDATARGSDAITITGDPLTAGLALARAGLVATIAHEHPYEFTDVPTDPGYASQWPLAAVGAPTAWTYEHGSASLVVAVIDSGVDATHPDLAGKLVAGWDAVANTALPAGNSDVIGHGTRVAGVIGAKTSNGAALASLGWNTKVMPVRVANSAGDISSTAVATGIRWAADHGAQVINLSLGSPCGDQLETEAVSYAQAHNVLVVASAGNDQRDGNRVMYPAALTGVVAVAATGRDGTRAWYSNSGSYVSIAAPGGSSDGNAADDVPVLVPGGSTGTAAGTSFAAPLVAAAAALVMAERPDLSAQGVADLLAATATNGVLNVGAAMTTAVDSTPPRQTPEVFSANLGSAVSIKSTPTSRGLLVLSKDGTVRALGDAPAFGSTPSANPAVTLTVTPTGLGYRIIDSHGCPTYLGDAGHFAQDICSTPLNGPVLDGATRPQGDGYWLVASDGGMFAFGAAPFFGSMGGQHLNGAVVGMAPAPDGSGYWEVAADGGIFSFGVPFLGSMGGSPLNKPVVGMVASGTGYMMVAADGGVFNFGNQFFGSLGGTPLADPIVSIAPSYNTVGQPNGYWMLDAGGLIYAFGAAWAP